MKTFISILTFVCVSFASSAQITVTNTLTPEQLVQNVLLGFGVTASNITVNGSPIDAQNIQGNATFFDAAGTTFPINTGVLLSTGNGVGAVGPNTIGSFTNNTPPTPNVSTDPHLNAIASAAPTNGIVLEFDFVPAGDTISFNYMFGSDEYPEFSPSTFNDAFGFFLWGPGISGPYALAGYPNGGANIALIPGTTTPVTINNVGPTSNPTYYLNNLGGAAYGAAIQYDGVTQDPNSITGLMAANASVFCDSTYHIKLAICNVGDQAYDSGVFLQANSFTSEAIEIAVATVSGDTAVYEGCSGADWLFIRPQSQLGDSLTVHYTITGTATEIADYNDLPDSIVFVPGVDTLILSMVPVADGIPDNNEYITITTSVVTPCGDTIVSSGTLYILDSLTIDLYETDPIVHCPNDSVLATVWTDGPLQPYTFSWSDGQVGDSAYFNTGPNNNSTDYIVTATNSCGYTATDTVTVTLFLTDTIDINELDPIVFCPQDSVLSSVSATGIYPPFTYSWSDGQTGDTAYFNAPAPNGSTDYIVTVTNACGFSTTDTVTVTLNQTLAIDSLVAVPTGSCDPTGSVEAFVSGTIGTQTYTWSGPGPNSPNTQPGTTWNNIGSGWYYFEVIDSVCQANDSVFVDIIQAPVADFTVSTDNGCTPLTVLFTNTSQNATSYVWDFGGGNIINTNNLDPQTQVFPGPTNVTLTASDNYGCSSSQSILIDVYICGCMDPNALNYDPNAVVDDGSCFYPDPIIVAPNVFTPNGDNTNDFVILDLTHVSALEMVILNRWGNVMFEGEGLNVSWDGRAQSGDDAPEGTYFIKYIATGLDGVTQVEGHSFVQLIRSK